MKTALVAGATGLIGNLLLRLLLASERYGKVIAISRKPLEIENPKLVNIVSGADTLASRQSSLRADDVFCCLGTTMRKAGTRENFRRVDFDYPLAIAQITRTEGANQFLLVSALGANKNSSIFYNRVKGETEEAIGGIAFASYHIFRPSLLLGDRSERRAGERAAQSVYKALGFLIPKRLKAIEAANVARAMLKIASIEQPGNHVHESDSLQDY